MLTYPYKDKKTRHALVFLVIGLLLVRAAAVFGSVASLICLFLIVLASLAIYRFHGQVRITADQVIFGLRRIKLEMIKSIAFKENELSYVVSYNNRTYTHSILPRESEEDIEAYRQALAGLVSSVRIHNVECMIDGRTTDFIQAGSDFYNLCADRCKREKEALKGIGGVLAYIVFSLVITCFLSIRDESKIIMSLMGQPPDTLDFAVSLAGAIVSGLAVIFIIVALILLFLKKPAFKKVFIAMLIYNLATTLLFIIADYIFYARLWPTFIEIIGNFIVVPANSIAVIFVWIVYFKRSIRVRNTFGGGPTSPPAISEGDAQ